MELPKAIHELEFNHGSIYGDEEAAAVAEVLRVGAARAARRSKQFEEAFAAYCGAGHGLAVSFGHGRAGAGDDRAATSGRATR